MANAKSVIEIDLKDEKFKAFQQAFEKHKKAVETMQEEWKKISDAIGNVAKKQQDFNKAAKDGAHALKNVATTTGTIARNLASSAVSIGKWLALGALGGGFGLGGLAGSASDYRRRAQGLGVTTGDLRAGNTTLNRYINTEATMGNIADIQSDLSRRQILARLGGGQNQSPADMLPSLMRNATALFKQGGQTSQYAEAMGLTQVFTLQELRRLASLNAKELDKTIKDFEESRKRLEVSDALSKQWQDFWYKLRDASQMLETSLIKNLTDLLPIFEKLTASVLDSLNAFLQDKEALNDFYDLAKNAGEGLLLLTKAVFEALATIPDVYRGLKIGGEKMRQWVGRWENPSDEKNWGLTKTEQEIYDRKQVKAGVKTLSEVNHNPGDLRFAGQLGAQRGAGGFAKFSSDEAGLQAMAAQLKLYQTRDKLNTLQEIISKYAPVSENDTGAYIKNVAKRTGIGANDKIDLNNASVLSSIISAMTKQENARSNFSPQTVQVVITGPSYLDVNASSNALPGSAR